MSEPKQYVGSGWEKKFDNGGSVINIRIKQAEIAKLKANKYGDVALVVGGRREPDSKSGATHWIAVDTYVPKEQREEAQQTFPDEEPPKRDDNDLPF